MIRFLAFFLAICMAALPATAQEPLRIFAAASLRGVIEDVAKESNTPVQMSFGGSGTMARQVANGAPADVVILANARWTEWLGAQGVTLAGASTVVAQNRLVLVATAGTAPLVTAQDLADRLGTARLAMGQRDAVPAGIYARQWLETSHLWPQLKDQLAETDNVRAALALVARGQAPYGVVYATDAAAEPRVVTVWDIPATAHDPIRYTALSLSPKGAAFAQSLITLDAQAVFARHGFAPVRP